MMDNQATCKNPIIEYVEARDKMIIECYEKMELKPFEDFIAKWNKMFDKDFLKRWNKAAPQVKWLTVIKMTEAVTNPDVRKYLPIARSMKAVLKTNCK